MKNKAIAIVCACLLFCVLFAGCGHQHTWVEATCTEPKTCSECGETEGEALGHDWVEATCTAPKTCSRCGATEGEALPHTLTEATYQSPAVCTVCGAEVGEPLTPAFEELGVKGQFMEVGQTYPYVTICYEEPSLKTTCDLTITNYESNASDPALPAKDGYVWKVVDVEILINDDNANMFGYQVSECNEDYYDILGHDATVTYAETPEPPYDSQCTFTVNWNGEDYECQRNYTGESTGWRDDHTVLITKHYEYLVPEGYDGCVLGFRDASIEWGDGMHISDIADDNTLFFRLK